MTVWYSRWAAMQPSALAALMAHSSAAACGDRQSARGRQIWACSVATEVEKYEGVIRREAAVHSLQDA